MSVDCRLFLFLCIVFFEIFEVFVQLLYILGCFVYMNVYVLELIYSYE